MREFGESAGYGNIQLQRVLFFGILNRGKGSLDKER